MADRSLNAVAVMAQGLSAKRTRIKTRSGVPVSAHEHLRAYQPKEQGLRLRRGNHGDTRGVPQGLSAKRTRIKTHTLGHDAGEAGQLRAYQPKEQGLRPPARA